MQLLEHRRSQAFPWSVLLALLISFSGCQTTQESLFTVSGAGWHVREGQALWKPGHKYPELGGDLVLASNNDGRCLIQFEKTPITMVSAQITPATWLIQFPQQQMRFSGHGEPSPRFLWLYLPAALSGKKLPKNLSFELKPDGEWRLESSRSGESLEGFVGP